MTIISNKYEVNIKNKFAEIKSILIYKNPFTRPLEIHYAVPVDPTYALTKLEVKYKSPSSKAPLNISKSSKLNTKKPKVKVILS